MPKHLFNIILIFLVTVAGGQEPRQYTFTHYTSSSGLISNQVNAIIQDADGYMWIGTTDGLQRYDGIRYKLFRHRSNDSASIPSNAIIQLLMDDKQNLWLLLGDGKTGIFNTRTFVFTEATVTTQKNISLRSPVKRLLKDQDGHIFFLLAGQEVLTWNEKKNEFSFVNNFFLRRPEWRIADFVQQPHTRKYWISIQDAGIAVYDHSTRQLSYDGNNAEKLPVIDKLGQKIKPYNLFFDSKGRLWFNTWGPGVPYTYCYDLQKNEFILYEHSFINDVKTYYEVRGFFEQQDGTIWVKGVKVFARFLENEKRFEQVYNGYSNEKSLAYRVITQLFEDKEKNIWIGTGNNGLFHFNPSAEIFTNISHINRSTGAAGDGSPLCYLQEKDSSILVGYWGDGLYRYDKNLRPIPIRIKGIEEKNLISVWDMCRDERTIWLASQPGLYAVDEQTRTAVYHNPKAMQNKTVREIAADKQGNLWLGMQGVGVFKWDAIKGKKKFDDGITKITVLPDAQVNKIIVDRNGYVWIATSSEGAYVIDPATDKMVMHFHPKAEGAYKLPEEGVSSLLDYSDTLMIIATGTNLLSYDRFTKKINTIASSDNISGYFASLEKDRAGNVWGSTTSLLYRINLRKKIFVTFNRNDGITNDYFVLSSSCVLADGRMLFGSSAIITAFDPLSVRLNYSRFPDVHITGFKVMNRDLLTDSLLRLKKIELGPEDNSLEIEFSYLRYIKDHAIKYKLDGLDKNWKIADEDHHATYSYLPPGTYTFMATTINAEGSSGPNITRLVIRINPPFWKTWWFFCLLALLIAIIFYWLDRQRINKLNALQKVRTEIAGNLHEEVNTTLNNISLLSEMARIKADKDTERSKEYIDQISAKSQNMIHAMDDILWSIDPDNDTMEKSLLRMMEYADSLKNLHGASIEIALDKKVRSLTPDMKTRHEILLIFKKALGMMVQYAGGRHTLVHIDLFRSRISVKLQDASARFEKNMAEIEDTIKDVHTRAAEIGADLDVQYDENGVTVILLVPVK
ncbi:MAG: hypothetical protein JNN00_09470 [Chitinophagaceae bacterium]|nr:hypothetical protein [Chitinophagaceae bacterium]